VPSQFGSCPTCGLVDRVENVAVVREHAVQTTRTTVAGPPVFTGPDQLAMPGPTQRRTVTRSTPLGRKLLPAPQGSAMPFAVFGVVLSAACAGSIYLNRSAAADTSGSVQYPFPGGNPLSAPAEVAQSPFPAAVPMVLGLLGAVFLLLAVTVWFRLRPVRRGRSAAEAVSRLGWYCGRCGTVYFQRGAAPAGAEDAKAYSLEQFRRFVFQAGGYEHLVGVRSVR